MKPSLYDVFSKFGPESMTVELGSKTWKFKRSIKRLKTECRDPDPIILFENSIRRVFSG